MEDLYELKEMLCEELKEYGKKGELSTGSLDVVDKLAHTVKNLDKIIETYEEEEYSGNYPMGGGRQGGGQDGRSYRGGSYRGSYARGRGRNARRDSMGRYSSEGYSRAVDDMVMQLQEMMQEAPDPKTKQEIQRLITKMEQM